MSSKSSTTYLLSSDLAMLQGVLDDAGYDSTSSFADPKRYNVAAKLLIKLFQGGITLPEELSGELDRHFGKSMSARSPVGFHRSRAAIQGLPVVSA